MTGNRSIARNRVLVDFGQGERRHVVMFSSGAGSAMAAKRVAERIRPRKPILLFADVNGEHGDNYRFLQEAAGWVDGQLVVIDNGGRTIWQVFAEVRFLGNSRVDPCSRVLKREPLRRWLDGNCEPTETIVYLGFDWTEEHRWQRAKKYWDPWRVECPLMWDPMVDKEQCMTTMVQDGLLPPLLTRQGFPHANCGGGCVKAGVRQFKRLLEISPSEFAKWEWNEERLRGQLGDVAILTDRRGGLRRPLPLRELRKRLEMQERLDLGGAENEWGACNCFSPVNPEKSSQELPVRPEPGD